MSFSYRWECSVKGQASDVLLKHYTMSQPRRSRLESSPPWQP